jgi:hypothetical protein
MIADEEHYLLLQTGTLGNEDISQTISFILEIILHKLPNVKKNSVDRHNTR